jgi:hypothetical protein
MPSSQLHRIVSSVVLGARWAEIGHKKLPLVGPYIAPIRNRAIREPLLGECSTTKVRDYLDQTRDPFRATCREYEDVVDAGSFFPRGDYLLNSLFVETTTYAALDLIFDYAANRKFKRNVVLIGPKGSGKTATQNCWLNRHCEALERSNILWIRCDAHRLYDIWHHDSDVSSVTGEPDRLNLVTLDEYLELKLVYVLAKHGRSVPGSLLWRITDEIDRQNPQFDNPIGRRRPAYRVTHVRDALCQFGHMIALEEGRHRPCAPAERGAPIVGGAGWRYLEDAVIPHSHKSLQRQKNQWLALSLAVQKVLRDMNVFLLRLIDGLDNVHLSRPNWEPYYKQMLKQASLLMGHDPGPWKMDLLTFRDRTFIDSRIEQDMPAAKTGQIDIRKLEMDAASLQAIYERRYQYMARHRPESDLFLRILRSILAMTLEEQPAAYNHDHRTFLHNRLTLVRQVYYRLLQRNNTSPSDAEIDVQVRSMSKRNLLLNDRFFLDTRVDWADLDQEIGACAFNIFHIHESFSPVHAGNNWWGLCGARLLIALSANGGLEEATLLEYLDSCWGYPRALTVAYGRSLRSFGMVNTRRCATTGATVWVISEAGQLYLERSFTDVATLYYCALDTPLPEGLVQAGVLCSHSNKIAYRTGYIRAAVGTAFVFLCFVGYISKEEVTAANRRRAECSERLRSLAHVTELPHESSAGKKALVASFERLFHALDVDDAREQLMDLLRRLGVGDVVLEHLGPNGPSASGTEQR